MNLKERIRKFRDRRFNEMIFISYSMGKVGSSSVESSLEQRLPYGLVFHCHFLSDHWLRERLPKLDPFFHGNIRIGSKIRDYLDKYPDRRIKIISLIREPISREVSNFFENWKPYYDDIEKVSSDEVIKVLGSSDYSYYSEWFDTEFKNYTGFDIFSNPFDKSKGYSIYSFGRFDILLLRLEDLNKVFSMAMQEFAGLEIVLSNSNVSLDKQGGELYKKVMSDYKLKREDLDRIYGQKVVRHFYSDQEISGFIQKWSSKQ